MILHFRLPFSEENYEDLSGCHKLPINKADVQQFVGEQNELSKTTAPDISENSQPLSLILLYFQAVLSVTVQRPTVMCRLMPIQETCQTFHSPSK
jgi:hypothetical protein